MKNLITLLLVISASIGAYAQDEETNIKTGWNVGGVPAITYNTDLGFQYGVVLNLFDYGDGTKYPSYNQMFYIEASRFTKGSSIYRIMFNSETLIPGISLTSDLAYLTDQAFDFYGYNGYDAVYNQTWTDDEQADDIYKTRMFYKTDRKLFRFKNDLNGRLAGDYWKWNAGFEIRSFNIDKVDIEKLNKGKDEDDPKRLPEEEETLYEKYLRWGILGDEEADGGFITTIKGGITYDSRDFKSNAMKGIWFETGVEASPSFISEVGFAKFYAIWRQYFTIVPEDLSLAYRLGYQTTIGGEVPFYYQNQIITSVLSGATSEGLGGSKNLRGVQRNRIIGDGLFYGNVELRWKAFRFNLINQNFYIGLVAFSDFGMVTKKVDFTIPVLEDGAGEPDEGLNETDFFLSDNESMHVSAGAGLRIVMNENFIIAADFGKAFNEQDGNSGFYIGLNYLF